MQDLFNKLFDFNDYKYFYHITGHGVGESIIENGLLMAEKEYYTTMVEITPDMITEPEKFLTDEKGFGAMERDEMVLIRVPKSMGYDFITPLSKGATDIFEDDKDASFVPSDFVLGYFDLDTLDFTPNDYTIEEIED